MQFFTKLTPDRIAEEVVGARRRVILAAPGIATGVATALVGALLEEHVAAQSTRDAS